MNKDNIIQPIGLKTACTEIQRVCAKSHLYKYCSLKPKHMIIPLAAGEGRTTFLEYMADMYRHHRILNFYSGGDDFIEVSFDGTLQQLQFTFAEINSAAIYTNSYENIIGMDVSNIALHLDEIQGREFLHNCQRICEHACVVFFTNATLTRNEERLLAKLEADLSNITRLKSDPYTIQDLAEIIEKAINERGIYFQKSKITQKQIVKLLTSYNVNCIKESAVIIDEIISNIDFSDRLLKTDWQAACKLKPILVHQQQKEHIK